VRNFFADFRYQSSLTRSGFEMEQKISEI